MWDLGWVGGGRSSISHIFFQSISTLLFVQLQTKWSCSCSLSHSHIRLTWILSLVSLNTIFFFTIQIYSYIKSRTQPSLSIHSAISVWSTGIKHTNTFFLTTHDFFFLPFSVCRYASWNSRTKCSRPSGNSSRSRPRPAPTSMSCLKPTLTTCAGSWTTWVTKNSNLSPTCSKWRAWSRTSRTSKWSGGFQPWAPRRIHFFY